jgi:hypothetical protein
MGMVTDYPRLNQKEYGNKKFSIEIQHDLQHDRYIGTVKDADENILVTVDTLESRIFFSAMVNAIKNEIKIIGEINMKISNELSENIIDEQRFMKH